MPQYIIDTEINKLDNLAWVPDPKLAFQLCHVIERQTDTTLIRVLDKNDNYEQV